MALEPITRQEQIIAGKDLEPITRLEKFLKEYGGSGGSGGGSGGVTTLHINVTAVNPETMAVTTFTADKTPLEMQQASVNGPIWCVLTFAAGIVSEEAKSFGVPPAWDSINTVAFGSLTLPVHDKNGDNYVTFFLLGIHSDNEWIIDLRPFAGS